MLEVAEHILASNSYSSTISKDAQPHHQTLILRMVMHSKGPGEDKSRECFFSCRPDMKWIQEDWGINPKKERYVHYIYVQYSTVYSKIDYKIM